MHSGVKKVGFCGTMMMGALETGKTRMNLLQALTPTNCTPTYGLGERVALFVFASRLFRPRVSAFGASEMLDGPLLPYSRVFA